MKIKFLLLTFLPFILGTKIGFPPLVIKVLTSTLFVFSYTLCFFYILLIQPEKKRKKILKDKIKNCKKEDTVIISAIIGKIKNISPLSIQIETIDGSIIEAPKESIIGIVDR